MTNTANKRIRTRFAPSPTGYLHIGNLRSALYNWLFAKKNDGDFILRIEDTDRNRLVPESIGQIYEALAWVGLTHSEGPDCGGPFAPYLQSERLDLYREHAERLVREGNAYPCFCTENRLKSLREDQVARKEATHYDRHCRALSEPERQSFHDAKTPYVIRLKLPETGNSTVDDLVRGKVVFAYDTLDDSVLLKSDGFPTYHLAVVIDDHIMEITHVLRAEEWLPSTPKHLFLYEAFGWVPPVFGHLSILLSPTGGKLSKRDGAVSVLDYRDQGYLPEALINFLVLLGWNPGNDREEFSLDELVESFSIEGLQKAGAVVDRKKLDHLNGRYLRKLSPQELLERAGERGLDLQNEYGERAPAAISLIQDRLVTLNDIPALSDFLLHLPDYDAKILVPKKGSAVRTHDILSALRDYYATLGEQLPLMEELKDTTIAFLKEKSWSNAEALWPLRVALSGAAQSPGVFEIAVVLGSKETLHRIETAQKKARIACRK